MAKAYMGSHWSSGRQWTLPYRISKNWKQQYTGSGKIWQFLRSDVTKEGWDAWWKLLSGYREATSRYWTFRLWMPCRHKMWHFLPTRATLTWLINSAAPYLKCIFLPKTAGALAISILNIKISNNCCVWWLTICCFYLLKSYFWPCAVINFSSALRDYALQENHGCANFFSMCILHVVTCMISASLTPI